MKHKISIKSYEYECGDGCCSEYGHEFFVNSKYVHKGPDKDSGWLAILRHLGHDVELVGLDENGEEIWEM